MNRYDLQRRLAVLLDEFLGGTDLVGVWALDAGCGTGHGTERLVARGARTVALDIGPDLVGITRARAHACLVVVGDVQALPFRSGQFNVVFSTEVVEHTASPATAVAECCRVLADGGCLVLSTPNRAWHWAVRLADWLKMRPYGAFENFLSPRELRSCVEAADCTVIRHVGVHILPFQLSILHGVLRFADRFGRRLLPIMINQCIQAERNSRAT